MILFLSLMVTGQRSQMVTFHTVILFFAAANSLPINNGFSVKFSPISSEEELKSKNNFGRIFAKIPQELDTKFSNDILSNAIFPRAADLRVGASNQIMKLMFPIQGPTRNESKMSDEFSFLNIPMVRQPIDDYKIIVATAPKHIRIGRGAEAKPVVVYIVFPDDDSHDVNSLNMPTVYFVSKHAINAPFEKTNKAEPIFIIDSNRRVTGLKSNEVSKFITFKNKLINSLKLVPKI